MEALEAGARLGPYRVDRILGRGGWGEVWAATHVDSGLGCAVKLLHTEHSAGIRQRVRFLREAVVGRAVRHPGLTEVYDVGEERGSVFIAFERLVGASLDTLMNTPERMPTTGFLELARQVAAALHAAHQAGFVHRDLKPANLFVHRPPGSNTLEMKVLDFGVAKLLASEDGLHTQTGSFLGSPRYVSPEHVLAPAQVDARTDLWALGVILFEGLTGTFPHEAPTVQELLRSVARDPPASIDTLRPALPAPLRELVRLCLRPRLGRIATAGAVADRLAAVIASAAISAGDRLPRRAQAAQVFAHTATVEELPEELATVTSILG